VTFPMRASSGESLLAVYDAFTIARFDFFKQQQLCESCAAEDASHLVTFLTHASSGESLLAVRHKVQNLSSKSRPEPCLTLICFPHSRGHWPPGDLPDARDQR